MNRKWQAACEQRRPKWLKTRANFKWSKPSYLSRKHCSFPTTGGDIQCEMTTESEQSSVFGGIRKPIQACFKQQLLFLLINKNVFVFFKSQWYFYRGQLSWTEVLAGRKEEKEIQAAVSNQPHQCALTYVWALCDKASPLWKCLTPVRCSFSLYGGGCGELTSRPLFITVP